MKRCPICFVETVGGKRCLSHGRGRAERDRLAVLELRARHDETQAVIEILKSAVNEARKRLPWRPYRRRARRIPSGAPAPLRLPAKP